jgi:hypothetical protein
VKRALWILVVLTAIGIALYTSEVYRQQLQREASVKALQEADATAKKAALVDDWRQKTVGWLDDMERWANLDCVPGVRNVKPDPNMKSPLQKVTEDISVTRL